MKIRTPELGYREISRVADFIRKIENGNKTIDMLQSKGIHLTIGYALYEDEPVLVDTENYTIYTEEDICKSEE